jgi:hypothetical protein
MKENDVFLRRNNIKRNHLVDNHWQNVRYIMLGLVWRCDTQGG